MTNIRLRKATCAVLLFTSACGRNTANEPARPDAAEVLRILAVTVAIQDFTQRNHAELAGLFYINAVQHGDSTHIKVSSLVYRSEVDDLAPCELSRLNGEWVLVKTRDCDNAARIHSLLDQLVPKALIDNRKRKYRVELDGDTVFFLPENIYYHPMVLTISVYKNRVIQVKEEGTG